MRILTFLLFSIAFIGCKTTSDQVPAEEQQEASETTDNAIIDGIPATVKYIALEGGFYGIVSDAGDSYLAINLEDEYKEDGLKIVFKMKERSDIMTTKMWGKTVEITEIARR